MSDFLTRLADRALAPQPIVQPRLQSLYEPAVMAASNGPVEEHLEIPAEAPRPPEPIQETRFRPREEQQNSKLAIDRTAREPAVTREAKSECAPQQQAISERNDSQRSPLPEKIEPVVRIRSAKREDQPPTTTREADRRASPAENAPVNQVPSVALSESATAESQVRPVESKPHPQRTRREADKEKTIFQESKPVVKKPMRQPTVVTVRSLRESRDSEPVLAAPLTPTRREKPVLAPSVNVMIGRVEIRAVTPPAPLPQANSVSPSTRLSLDEYLKRNAGGGR